MSDDVQTVAPAAAGLEAHKGWLVEEGDRIGGLVAGHPDWKSQIRGILEAARHETHPKVLENLIRYQESRIESWRANDVAGELEKALGKCQKLAGDDLSLAMELIRHLLLYTLRAHAAASKADTDTPGAKTS